MRVILTFLLLASITFAQNEVYFLSDPAPSPDGELIVFSYDSDIWSVPTEGGTASRITAMAGHESRPVYSPDGKWIAFTSTQTGNADIYVVPAEGGKITQLTFNDATDNMESWSWDSKSIYFTSNRFNPMTAFKMDIDGGTPVRLFTGYKNRQHNIAEHPTSGDIFFNETFESYGNTFRKRYKGDYNPDIKSYNFASGEYVEYTSYRGKDMWVSIDKEGKVYFASDEGTGEYNLFALNENKESLTSFNTSIGRPRVSAEGNIIVFEKDYQIYRYDVLNGTTKKVDIKTYENNPLVFSDDFKTEGKISNFDVSPDGKKIAFVSRGILFVSDLKGKFVKQIETDSKERVIEVLWLDDSETVLYNRTVKGWLNLFTQKVTKPNSEKQHTTDNQNNQEINLNGDRTKGLYFSGRNELRMIDLKTLKSETIVRDEFWAIYNTPAYFSPDDKYVVYVAYRNFEHDIFVYDIENKESKHLTKTGVTETDPFWSPDGKYIYFSSDRFRATYPWGTDDAEIHRIALKKFDKEYRADEFSKLFKEEKKDTTKPVVKIDFDGLNDRWTTLIDFPGNQEGIYVVQKDEETNILYASNHDNTGRGLWKTVYKSFGKKETKRITSLGDEDFQIVEAKGNHYLRANNKVYSLNLGQSKAEEISISYKFTKDLKNEFEQMFYEAYANLTENFYDGNFHGLDWPSIREKYSKYLPYMKSRRDLRTLFTDLLGELNASHLRFTSTGPEEEVHVEYTSAYTGIVFDNENPYLIDYVVEKSPSDKESIHLQEGDKLMSVNGIDVNYNLNREFYFAGPFRSEEMILGFARSGQKFNVKVHPYSRRNFLSDLYGEWSKQRQQIVDEKSDKKIAYIHLQVNTQPELRQFLIEMSNEAHYREGLILDLRYNYGGNIHDNLLQFLSQKSYTQWKYRDGAMTPQPNFSPSDKPIVLLINEQSLSDAEMTANGFKALGLGTIVGTETYRWLIFTSGKNLVDGSFYRLPSWGCYTIDGKNIEEFGASPDVYIKNTMPDRHTGKDPQLEKAIEIIKAELSR